MNRYTKLFLPLTLMSLLAVGWFFSTYDKASALSQPQVQQSDDKTRTIQVSGAAEIQVEPDIAIVRLGVQTDAKTAQEAMNQNNSKVQALIGSLKKYNIPSQNIQTQTIRLAPRYENGDPNNPATLVGYTASNIVEVQSKDLDSLGALLDDAVHAGANTIEAIRFKVSDPGTALDRAREAAVEDAHHKAEQLAQLAGASLGSIVEIQENTSSPVPLSPESSMTSAVPVSPGTQVVSIQVHMTWSLVVDSNQ